MVPMPPARNACRAPGLDRSGRRAQHDGGDSWQRMVEPFDAFRKGRWAELRECGQALIATPREAGEHGSPTRTTLRDCSR